MLSVRFLVKMSSGDTIELNIAALLPNSHKVKGLLRNLFSFTSILKFT